MRIICRVAFGVNFSSISARSFSLIVASFSGFTNDSGSRLQTIAVRYENDKTLPHLSQLRSHLITGGSTCALLSANVVAQYGGVVVFARRSSLTFTCDQFSSIPPTHQRTVVAACTVVHGTSFWAAKYTPAPTAVHATAPRSHLMLSHTESMH